MYNESMKAKYPDSELVDRMACECIAVRVRLINRVISALYDEALRPLGLRVSQGNILVAVARKGDAKPAEICRILRIDKSTLSRDVELMKSEGWLESEPAQGGRNQTLRITSKGLDLVRAARPAWDKAQARAAELIGEGGVRSLEQIAARLGFGQPAS
jgi:DNA-binding MarR family transcriptional regulator